MKPQGGGRLFCTHPLEKPLPQANRQFQGDLRQDGSCQGTTDSCRATRENAATASAPLRRLTSLHTSIVPNTTCRPSKKLSPIMITVAPPVVHPSLGLMALMHGVAARTRQRMQTLAPRPAGLHQPLCPPPAPGHRRRTAGPFLQAPRKGRSYISGLVCLTQSIQCFIKQRPSLGILVSKKKNDLM